MLYRIYSILNQFFIFQGFLETNDEVSILFKMVQNVWVLKSENVWCFQHFISFELHPQSCEEVINGSEAECLINNSYFFICLALNILIFSIFQYFNSILLSSLISQDSIITMPIICCTYLGEFLRSIFKAKSQVETSPVS